MPLALRLLPVLLVLTACGERSPARIVGDPDGQPIAIDVRYADAALDSLTASGPFQRTVVIERQPWPDPWYGVGACRHDHFHTVGGAAWGPSYRYEPATSLHLLLGRGPAEGQWLRLALDDGGWKGWVPIRPGTEVVVSLQASGGRTGFIEIGRFTAAADQRLIVHLDGARPSLETQTPAP